MPKIADHARAARRDQILAAALACFARSGFHASTMAEVAEEATVSKGTPYLYFPSKEALYTALYEEWHCALDERIETAIADLADGDRHTPRQLFRAAVAAVGEHVIEHESTCRVLMEAYMLAAYIPAISEVVRASEDRFRQRVEHLILDGVAAGEWPADTNAAVEARLMIATVNGLMAQWHLEPGSFDWDTAATALARGSPPCVSET
jgi:TetR/AcrR family transcriptional repressor of uid operon